jgi:hypothetical protein
VHLHVGTGAVQHLAGGVGELARQRERHADLHGLLRVRGTERRGERCRGKGRGEPCSLHRSSSVILNFVLYDRGRF